MIHAHCPFCGHRRRWLRLPAWPLVAVARRWLAAYVTLFWPVIRTRQALVNVHFRPCAGACAGACACGTCSELKADDTSWRPFDGQSYFRTYCCLQPSSHPSFCASVHPSFHPSTGRAVSCGPALLYLLVDLGFIVLTMTHVLAHLTR